MEGSAAWSSGHSCVARPRSSGHVILVPAVTLCASARA